jgi:hypothetical protein
MYGWHNIFEIILKQIMKEDSSQQNGNKDQQTESNVLPATEVVSNPNPRANENIQNRESVSETGNSDDSLTGSEITDGEDA